MQVLLWQNTKIKQNKIELKYTENNKRTRKSLVLFVLDLLYGQASLHILAKTKTHPSNPLHSLQTLFVLTKFITNNATIPAFGQAKACQKQGLFNFPIDEGMNGGGEAQPFIYTSKTIWIGLAKPVPQAGCQGNTKELFCGQMVYTFYHIQLVAR